MGVLGVFFGCRGDGGFNGCCSGARSGVVGFNAAMLLRLMREKVRPAWSDGGREREKVRPAYEKWPKMGVFWRAGRTISRKSHGRGRVGRVFSRKCRWRPAAGRVFSHQLTLRPGLVGDVAHEAGCGGGFAALEAGWRRVAGVSYL